MTTTKRSEISDRKLREAGKRAVESPEHLSSVLEINPTGSTLNVIEECLICISNPKI